MWTEPLPDRTRTRGPVLILVVWLVVVIAFGVSMIRSRGVQPDAVTADVQGPPQSIYVVGTNDAAFRKAYPHHHCVYSQEGSRYGSPACRP